MNTDANANANANASSAAAAPLKKVVIGLGSGRSGTASLTSLIDKQHGGLCFHEMNPAGAVFSGNAQPHLNTVREFSALLDGGDRSRLAIDYSRPSSVATYEQLQQLPQLNLLGDIAYYYLNYVDEILLQSPQCVFVCIKRDRSQTVGSWMKKSAINRWPSIWLADRLKALITRTPFYTQYNYWQEHDGSRWKKDPLWDSCFPKFEAASKEEAIGLYWDYYYLEAEKLQAKHPQNFRTFAVEQLSDPDGQRQILAFVGLESEQMVLPEDVHLHKST